MRRLGDVMSFMAIIVVIVSVSGYPGAMERRASENAATIAVGSYLDDVEGNANHGSAYEFLDEPVIPGVACSYWLEVVDVHGVASRYGPISAAVRQRPWLPLVSR